ncbi:MAG: hypothetical protein HYY24_07690 [Verrucomicrobia bacterium]|nr:hypothetical protein [Verrucomicrobiota bacterium]
MSTVELAVKKVKGLSVSQVRALLAWLEMQETKRRRTARSRRAARRKPRRQQSMRDLMAWYGSIRGTTDWEPRRMPPDLVHKVSL